MPAEHSVKIKEGKKLNKYLDHARGTEKVMTVITIVVGAFGSVPKNMEEKLDELGIRGSAETIWIKAHLKLAWILRRV